MRRKTAAVSALIAVFCFTFIFTSCNKSDDSSNETTDETLSQINETSDTILTTEAGAAPETTAAPETATAPPAVYPPATTVINTTAAVSEEIISEELPKETFERINAIYRASNTGPQTIRTVHQLAIITSICQTAQGGGRGPITITPATLNGEEITLMTLGGTEFKEGQATTIEESQLAAYGKSNDYLKAVIKLIKNHTVPQNKPLLVTGISLGGMIAQQIACEHELMKENGIKVIAVITFGSPLTRPLDRQGIKIVRFADKNDMVPKLGEMTLYNEAQNAGGFGNLIKDINELNEKERILRSGKYKKPIETHALSYIEDSCWDDFDFMGSTKKENVLVLKQGLTFYPAPKIS